MNLYSLYSIAQKRYNVPFVAMDDTDAIDRVTKMVCGQGDPALISSLDDLQLRNVGTFNPNVENDGDPIWFSSDANCLVMDDLHNNLPLPPTVKAGVDKFFGGARNG